MLERSQIEQPEDSLKKAEEILAGSGLELEDETNENVGQHLSRTPKEIKSFDDAFETTEEGRKIIEEKLKNVQADLEKEYEKHTGQSAEKQTYERAILSTKKTQDIIAEKLEGSGLENMTLEDIDK